MPEFNPQSSGLPALTQARVDALGRDFASRFAAQFAEPPVAQSFFTAARFVRRAVAGLCWPGPAWRPPYSQLDRPLSFAAADLINDPALQSWLRVLPPGVALADSPGALTFANGEALICFLGGLVRRMREQPPCRSQSPAPQHFEVPAAAPERSAWAAVPRTRPLVEFAAALRQAAPPGLTPLIFGSLAEPPPWPAYADVDLALYLEDEVFESRGELLAFIARFRQGAARLCAVDPIQHHGPYVLLAAEDGHYSPAFLPPATLRGAQALAGRPLPLTLAPLAEDRVFALESLLGAWRGLRHLARAGWRTLADRYTAKYFSSLALLTPALFCGCLGRPVDKRASFEVFKAEMDPASVAAIGALERFRLEWRWTLSPPRGLLDLAGARAGWLARTLNRWPAPAAGARLKALAPLIDPLFEAILERLEQP